MCLCVRIKIIRNRTDTGKSEGENSIVEQALTF